MPTLPQELIIPGFLILIFLGSSFGWWLGIKKAAREESFAQIDARMNERLGWLPEWRTHVDSAQKDNSAQLLDHERRISKVEARP